MDEAGALSQCVWIPPALIAPDDTNDAFQSWFPTAFAMYVVGVGVGAIAVPTASFLPCPHVHPLTQTFVCVVGF